MSEKCLLAEFETIEKANVALDILFQQDLIDQTTVLTHRTYVPQTLVEETQTPPTPGEKVDMGSKIGAGAAIGASIAIPLTVSTLLGPIAILGTAAAVIAGGGVAGITEAASRNSVSKSDQEGWIERLQHGHVVLLIRGNEMETREASDGLKTIGPTSLYEYSPSVEDNTL